jgi:hypothetical protein
MLLCLEFMTAIIMGVNQHLAIALKMAYERSINLWKSKKVMAILHTCLILTWNFNLLYQPPCTSHTNVHKLMHDNVVNSPMQLWHRGQEWHSHGGHLHYIWISSVATSQTKAWLCINDLLTQIFYQKEK